MTDNNEAPGAITHEDGYFEARLARTIAHEPKTVWAALTEPEQFVNWLAPGTIEKRRGGLARLDFVDSGIVIDSTVTEFDAPEVLEYSWSSSGEPDRPIRFELEPVAGGTRLVLRIAVPDNEDMARSCAGWEAHLMMLLAALEGVPIKFPFERFQQTREVYKQMIAAL
ncbi:MAG: SRPBCC family protein [Pseudomonadota bacterium]